RLDMTREIDQWFRGYVGSEHLAAFARLIGANVDGYDVHPTPPHELSVRLLSGRGIVNVRSPAARSLVLTYSVEGGAVAEVSQLYFPLWRLRGLVAETADLRGSPAGLLVVPLPSSKHEVTLRYDLGWPERLGVTITLVSLVAVLGGALLSG